MNKTNTSKQTNLHYEVVDALLKLIVDLESCGVFYVIIKDVALKLKNNESLDGIGKVYIVCPRSFFNEPYARNILLTVLLKYNPQITNSRITFKLDNLIDVEIRIKEKMHKCLLNPDYVNVLGEKLPVPNPINEYIKVKNFI